MGRPHFSRMHTRGYEYYGLLYVGNSRNCYIFVNASLGMDPCAPLLLQHIMIKCKQITRAVIAFLIFHLLCRKSEQMQIKATPTFAYDLVLKMYILRHLECQPFDIILGLFISMWNCHSKVYKILRSESIIDDDPNFAPVLRIIRMGYSKETIFDFLPASAIIHDRPRPILVLPYHLKIPHTYSRRC